MKKLLLVGIVGLSAMLGGCGGSGDCDETLPPVTEATFPNNQTPEYVIRTASEIEARGTSFYGQVTSMEVLEDGRANVIIQRFDADYSDGYQTKPTNTVTEGVAVFYAKVGALAERLRVDDLKKLSGSLPTVAVRGEIDGSLRLELSLPVMGDFQRFDGVTARINDFDYQVGSVDGDLYVGSWATGLTDGDKLNLIQLSVTASAWGVLIPVDVHDIVSSKGFTYKNVDGDEITVYLNEGLTVYPTDRVKDTSELRVGEKVLIQANYLDTVIGDANVYRAE